MDEQIRKFAWTIIIITIILISSTMTLLYFFDYAEARDKCYDELGEDYNLLLPSRALEPGYIECCKTVYVDHIKKNDCKIIRRID